MEVDSGTERSTVPLLIFQQKLADACELQASTVSLLQYDKSPFTIVGESQVKVKINHRFIPTTFVVVDIEHQLPPLGRYWMSLLHFDVATLMEQVTQVHHTSESTMAAEIMTEFGDVFIGIPKGIEPTVTVDKSSPPHFNKPWSAPFVLKEKVEQRLDK